eukprot:TRINITY_DN750_c0_g1_i2.p1 TRINITY_DN750_c0_g1~~TRINITY_DN750_c0_g1_i2.p1  ORF type:complete len:427 (+),score=115.31 TRINITY_DN750_c0_g1_i2:39-1319(+)
MSKAYTLEEVAKHNTEKDCWIVVNDVVYDVTSFLADHPGGKRVLLKVAGKDASKEFKQFHSDSILQQYGPKLQVGNVGSGSVVSEIESQMPSEDSQKFGNMVPFGDPLWYQGWHSPYYNVSHNRYRAAVRQWVEKELMPYVDEWDEKKTVPYRELLQKSAKAGILGGFLGAIWRKEYCGTFIAGGVKPEEWDAFHGYILNDEFARTGSGTATGWVIGLGIGLPPVVYFGNDQLKEKVIPPVMKGEKIICLAITEPSAGSDVANINTTAKLTEDGKYYIVNGEKKWITNGVWADFFTTAVRTGGSGMEGISVLVVERGPGVTTRQMDCSGLWGSGTTYVTFEDAKVPVENLIGVENAGFMIIVYNFNQERLGLCIQATRFARVCLEEAIKYAHKRKTFGKFLIDHAVIREKIAHMTRFVETTQTLIE